MGFLQDEISDFLEKLAPVMPHSRNDSGSFSFFILLASNEGTSEEILGVLQTSKHHVEGQFQGSGSECGCIHSSLMGKKRLSCGGKKGT